MNFTLPNITTDMSIDACSLNQYALVEATNKLPKIAFYLVVAIFFFLLLRQLIEPWFKDYKYRETVRESLVGFAFASSIWAILLLFYFTFQLTTAQIKHIESVAIYILIPLVAFGLFWNWRNWKHD